MKEQTKTEMGGQGRRSRKGRNTGSSGRLAIDQLDWILPSYSDQPVEPLTEDHLDRIHDTSMRVLEEIGIVFLNEEALDILSKAGCDVDVANQNVRMDRALVMEMVHRAPSQFTITPRNPDRALTIGGNNMVYS
ncbi:MAG: trimethylamine methyltransferase family protein, partial [Candidatus Puniceispirillales bacterium]